MLLALRSLWEEQAGNGVIVSGEGVAANPAIGAGLVLTERGIFGGKRKRVRYWNEIVSPMSMPVPVDVEFVGEGVAANPAIGAGLVIIEVDFAEEELVALFMATAA